jgi:ribonuclease G
VAVLEDDQVVEVYFQRENEYSLAGSIHKGRVTRVLPGMQSAFVDLGLERDAFLYVSDFFEDNEEYDKIVSSVEDQVLRLQKGGSAPPPAVAAVEAPASRPAEQAEPAAVVPAATVVDARPPEREPRGEFRGEPRGDNRGDRGDRGDRDRRGRRSRRRRPGKGPHIPESKYYSPAREAAPEPAAPAEETTTEPDDFFVLPGESLAKYTHHEGGEPDTEGEEPMDLAGDSEPGTPMAFKAEAAETEETPAEENAAEEPRLVLSDESEDAAEMGVPAPENMDLPGAVPETGNGAEESEAAAGEQETAAEEPDAAEEAEAAAEAAEPAAAVGNEETEATAEDIEPAAAATAEEAESAEDVEPLAEAAGEAPAAEEQSETEPEPARIITSLTATLREQGPRYLHRVSRRMRRKGGRGGEAPEFRPENQRAAAPPPRQEQQRTASRPETGREKPAAPSISDLLREGQEIIVQIAKEPLGQKGARITSHIALPGRFLVYMPTVDHIGVSRKIASDEERSRLKRILQSHRAGIPGGYIVRTAGEGQSEEELRADMMFLYNLWLDMRQKAEKKPAPALIHHDLDVVERTLRDQLTQQFKNIWVDNEEVYENVLRFVQRFQPTLVGRVKLYTRPNPMFDEFNITSELEKALRPKVWLKSGGYIVINQTEALVAIDVNTGKYVGRSNRLEDTIVKTNTDAIKEIVRQIRLRDLGGIIVVDFIDMDERKNRQKVMQALEEAMRSDRAPYKILQFNDFGLVAITRKRVKQSLERTLCSPCPYCEGAGYIKSVGTVIGEILVEANKIARAVEGDDVMLRVNPEVAKVLKSAHNQYLQELEEILGRTVIVKSDPALHQEKFDLA